MTIEEIKAFLESNKDKPEVSAFLGELSAVSADKVKGFLQTDEGKRLIQPDLDRYHAKSLESWKTNNLEKLVEDEVAKRNPAETEEQKRIRLLEQKLEEKDKEAQREKLMNLAIKQANEKGLPADIVSFFLADDEEATTTNLTKLEETFTKAVQTGIESRFKENGREIQTGGTGSAPVKSFADLAAQNNIRTQ
jgi:hypothetical protein